MLRETLPKQKHKYYAKKKGLLTMEGYIRWKNTHLEDEDIIRELNEIEGDEAAIFDRFRCDLEFGTGGLRGLLGVGTNRMNIYTVGLATQGLATSLKKNAKTKKKLSVAIARDSRNKGEAFVRRAASVLAANGITALVYPELAPTPALSFAVRYYGCDAGICVTASHNPAVYNGYKAYGDDGCQLGPQLADAVLAETKNTDIFDGVKTVDYDKAVEDGLIVMIGDDCYEAFWKEVEAQSLLSDDVREGDPLKVVYTPLNGAGRRSVMQILSKEKCYDVTVVKEQEMPDGNFPTCPYPNPENPEAIKLALEYCEKVGADIMVATDPDCDRCRPAAKNGDKYEALSGNQTGILLMDYIMKRKNELGIMPKDPVAVTTIVSTAMADSVAKGNGVELRRVLTGFKYIGEQIALLEQEGHPERYIFGFEESCGYLSGGYVRDKDGVDASMLVCEMALYYKRKGMTLFDAFDELSKKYGYFKEDLMNFAFEGADGAVKMQSIIENMRANPPKALAGSEIVKLIDYHKAGLRDGEPNPDTGLPDSNVLEFNMANGTKVIVRPSGTEPKMKAYISASGKNTDEALEKIAKIKEDIHSLGF